MIKINSSYTLNKKDPKAIVYNTSFGAACPERTAKIRKGRAQTHSAFGHTDFVKLPSGLNRRTRKRCPRFALFRLPGYFEKRNVLRLNLLLYTV